MTCERLAKTVLVSLPISVVEALLTIRSALDGDVTSSIAKSLARARPLDTALLGQVPPCFAVNDRGKYAAEFLGIEFAVETLAAVFGRVVDMLADVAPDALVSLAEVRTRGRRFVSLEPSHIHPYSPHLPVLQTASGWWISANISQDQLKLALRTLCEVSGLSFGGDIKFPL